MIAVDHGVGVDEAFKRLRAYTRTRHASLHDVAHAIVNLGLHVPDDN
jgi:AmiR/NasT family two-component response regulator